MSEQTEMLVVAKEQETSMIRLAIEKGAGIETIERLVALQERMLARQAETEFSDAMNRVQEKIKRVAPDAFNQHTQSRWATYAALDKAIRPIYAAEGFSISFTHADCPKPDFIRVICWVRLHAHKEAYQVDWPVSTKGPKGSDVVTSVQATGISDSYAKRYLLKDIFNIAVGEDDSDGNLPKMADEALEKAKDAISHAKDPEDLKLIFTVVYKEAQKARDREAMSELIRQKDMKKQEFIDAAC